jgi:2-C-methyl-D-erythritol 4-phosphate cytidylyltransferase
VQKGLELLKDEIDLVAVHDSVRCCPKKQWLDDCFKKADETGAAMLANPVVATIKKVKEGVIEKTVDRTGLYEAQTPQVFKKELLIKAYANLDKVDRDTISDDAQLVEALGEKVAVVETDYSNIKITTAADVAIAEAIIKLRSVESKKKTGYVGPYGEPQW